MAILPDALAWEQKLTARKDGVYTFEIRPRRGDKSFQPANTNGSQRGGRPFVEFLPQRIGPATLLEGGDLKPVIADNFILIPNPVTCDPQRTYRLRFRADAL
jgi:hypothetical protein